MPATRNTSLATQHSLTDEEMRALADRVPIERRALFEAWLRGERSLDGDLVMERADGAADA